MCYGMKCKYEQRYTGECTLKGANLPIDASCRDMEDWVCQECGSWFELCDAEILDSEDETVQCPHCNSTDTHK